MAEIAGCGCEDGDSGDTGIQSSIACCCCARLVWLTCGTVQGLLHVGFTVLPYQSQPFLLGRCCDSLCCPDITLLPSPVLLAAAKPPATRL